MQTEAVANNIINWLQNYANTANVNGFVVGISGGIDSAVTSTLCAKTKLNVLCLELPIHQPKSHVSRAKAHINFLKETYPNVSSREINLTQPFEAFKRKVTETNDKDKVNLALANSRSRLRMTTLYYYASLYGLLVAGTGNKVEDFGVGFFTKYGDGGVDLSPIGDLYKSEVYKLASFLNINDTIIKAEPSDGLFDDERNDEQQIGASYPELEWAMLMQREGKIVNDFEGRQRTVYSIYTRLNAINKHKMIPVPVCKIDESLK